jgi:Skp family chaperone for outer membrane proteins
MAAPFDTLRLARRPEAAGFAPQQAGDMAEAIAEALSQLSTKADLAALVAATKADLAALRTELKADMDALRAELKADMDALRAELKGDMEILKRDMTIRLGSMMIVAVGVILAGFKLIH